MILDAVEGDRISRLIFIGGRVATASAEDALGRALFLKRLVYRSPDEKFNIASMGCSGKGASCIDGCSSRA